MRTKWLGHALGTPALLAGALAPFALRAADAPSHAAAHASAQTPLEGRAPPVASYTLEARLDAERHRIRAHGTIRFLNASRVALHELWFHLYLNAFKNDKTLFLRSPFGAGRSGKKAEEWGYIDVKRLTLPDRGQAELWANAEPHSPNDPDDQTDIRVPLPEPLAAGETLVLETEFEAQLPEIVERTGYKGDFQFVAQWFPKLAKLEPDGHFEHFAFHPQSEFYADFGDYEVTLDVPASLRVGATGELVKSSTDQDRTRLVYRAESVHDFAWTAWSSFRERQERIAGVNVRVLFPPWHDANAEAELGAMRFALPYFNAHYGRYPYPTLTVVHPPAAAGNAGGMEYPTLITTGGPFYAPLLGVHSSEIVTIHELGHQWFYGLVATDEHSFPFLDEGLNSYAEGRALEAYFGVASVVGRFGLSVSDWSLFRTFSAARGQDGIVAAPAASFTTFRSLGALVYSRTATILATIGRVYGMERLEHALGEYTRSMRFSHPRPAEFMDVMKRELGTEVAAVLESALFERGHVDYVARELSSVPADPEGGIFDGPHGRETRKPTPKRPAARWLGRVVVYRHGTLELPVDIDLIAEDGSRRREHWDGHGLAHAIDYSGASRLTAVQVDPERRILLDDDLMNNALSDHPARASRVWEGVTYAAELLLSGLGP
jgi:Peptidase family M1 domain